MKSSIILILLFALYTSSLTASPNQQFELGNKYYRFGDYSKAIATYELVAKQGFNSAALLYNLGNAFYKDGNYAKSILNYERALKLNPRDEDIKFNLRLAGMNTVDKIEPIPLLFYEEWWNNFISIFSSDTWSKLGIAACWLTLLFAGIYIFTNSIYLKKTGFFGGAFFFITAIFLLIAGRVQYNRLYNQKAAIIMETSTYIKSSPEIKSTNLFMLHAGTKIEIIDELQGWKKIKIANGNIGWVKTEDIEII